MTNGSSPLTRGKRHADLLTCAPARLIPAHAGKTDAVSHGVCLKQAHPRSRGENCGSRALASRARGSSPLTRGKPLAYTEADDARGLIPAHAGKTWQR